MILLCRAEDGHVVQSNAAFRDFHALIHSELGLEPDAILAYFSDGRRLTSSNSRELPAGATLFVFNKFYLDYDIEHVLATLRVEPNLQPSVEEDISSTPPYRPSQLANSYLRTAHAHWEQLNQLAKGLGYQHEALRIASSSLDLNVLAIIDTFESISTPARKELEKQATLLAGLDSDLLLISRVNVHNEFVSPSVRKAIESGSSPQRTLKDYVSTGKMHQVADTCRRIHNELKEKFIEMENAVQSLKRGADQVRARANDTQLLDDATLGVRRAKEVFERIEEIATSPSVNDSVIKELKILDTTLRTELSALCTTKNAYTNHLLTTLRQISSLNSTLLTLPQSLTSLQLSFRPTGASGTPNAKVNSFSHILRLHNMLYAYGATLVEIVRRKEFDKFFYARAQSVLEVMAKVSANERKRRQVYRSEIYGQLPFETRGMEDVSVPTIDFSPTRPASDYVYALEREDVDELLSLLDDLEDTSNTNQDTFALVALRECKVGLDKLVEKMQKIEGGFDKIAERVLLSSSRLDQSRRRSIEADDQEYQELVERIRSLEETKAQEETRFLSEKASLESELRHLRSRLSDLSTTLSEERTRSERLERDLSGAHSQNETEIEKRKVLEELHSDLTTDMKMQTLELQRALADATSQAQVAETLRRELEVMQAEFEEIKALESRHEEHVQQLLEEQAKNLQLLEEARSRGEDLQEQIRKAQEESDDVREVLREKEREKERVVREKVNEHERVMRDCRAEADGDRAILERRFEEVRALKEGAERELRETKGELDSARMDIGALKMELGRVERELAVGRDVERVLRDDLKTGQASRESFEIRVEKSERLLAEFIDVAIAFRDSHLKALNSAQAMTAHPGSRQSSATLAESVFSASGLRHSIIPNSVQDEPLPIDPSDPPAVLEVLRAFDHDVFLEAIAKTGSTIRKWQRQYKEYRERSKGKITFRNFAKGDLALFLPTRNSISKPWAAFNVSFPHYFLQATGHLAEQLKAREWIVARITSISERVVSHTDPSSNPYGLGDGVKYYMLEVEDWTQPTTTPTGTKRKASSMKKVAQETAETSQTTPSLPLGNTATVTVPAAPPEAEVEDTFRVAHSPNSHLFPVHHARINSSSPPHRPSSLSRLLAQAPAETDTTMSTPSPSKSPPAASSPSASVLPQPTESAPNNPTSPLRPGSRTSKHSRVSSSNNSRFSAGKIPAIGSVSSNASGFATKATATTALALGGDQPLSASPIEIAGPSLSTPSPEGSVTEGLTGFTQRRRTSSYLPASSGSTTPDGGSRQRTMSNTASSATATLANFASSWGMSFGRKKGSSTKIDLSRLATTAAASGAATGIPSPLSNEGERASDLLKRF